MQPPTPVLRQFQKFKARHPAYVLLFRIGDAYELFHADAELARGVLGVDVAMRSDVPVASVPADRVEVSLRRLIAAGHRCALCEEAGS